MEGVKYLGMNSSQDIPVRFLIYLSQSRNQMKKSITEALRLHGKKVSVVQSQLEVSVVNLFFFLPMFYPLEEEDIVA
jgi:hypothetical protein